MTKRDWKKELEAVYLIFFMAFILEQRYQWATKLTDGVRGWLRRRDEAFRRSMSDRFDLWYDDVLKTRQAEIDRLEEAYGDG
jgi:hypothetical protein